MKNFTFILAFSMLFVFTAKATVHTVSNDANQPAEWTNLQMACDSANVGDTIYVQGTPTDYCTGLTSSVLHIKKRLHLIGVGIKPEWNYLYGYPSYISTIYLDTVAFISGASGTIIEGIKTATISCTYPSNSVCQDLIFRRNRINSTLSLNNANNALIINNIIQGSYLSLSNGTNIIVMNNIFQCYIGSSSSSTIISNNLFLASAAFSGCQSSTITNNIFYYAEVTGATYSNFSNNMGFGISTNVLQGSNTGSNNVNADPQFLYLFSTTNHAYNDQNKYILKSTSTGKNAGTDGTDIGIYGGQYPWPASALNNYIHCIPPMIPMMQELIIQNSSVPANGNLNFSVKAYKTSR